MQALWHQYGEIATVLAYLLSSTIAIAHLLVFKSNSVSAAAWLVFVLVMPFAGPLLYWLFGINRIQGDATALRGMRWSDQGAVPGTIVPHLEGERGLVRVGRVVSGAEMASGHTVELLINGERAFPAMLGAIDGARSEVLLTTYIFDDDDTGQRFVSALARARERGVQVLVLLDDLGRRTSAPGILPALLRANLTVLRFMPMQLIPPKFSVNLRNHRKLLIVDQTQGFAGGMNIGDRQLLSGDVTRRAADIHFEFGGPVVADMRELFVSDWQRCGGSDPGPLQALPVAQGAAACRLIADGPDERLDHLVLLLIGVIAAAQRRVVILTPYFLPDRRLLGALQSAALRGVRVQVLIPERCNWPFVRWALNHTVWDLLMTGVEVLEQPGTFAHSKCLLIDDDYALVGSANLDPRSLRLNFELAIEIVDSAFSAQLHAYVEPLLECSRRLSLQALSQRSLPSRLRDAAAALFAPYL
ncbi:MAG: phospholipase D-like domain-containing protein [Pseudomonadales bacterium]